ncbi:hypothetical protein [Cryptosporangium phraense]|nr:hypothetical protein [Cryptosporangium phraense]
MASIMNRLRAFARSPQGQRLAARAQQELSKPSNQQKLRKLSSRLKGRRY